MTWWSRIKNGWFGGANFAESGVETVTPQTPDRQAIINEVATRQTAGEWLAGLGDLPDPDPVLRKHGGGTDVLEELLADPHVTCCVQQRKLASLAKSWRLEPGGEPGREPDRQALDLRDQLVRDLDRVDLAGLTSALLDAPYFGFTAVEIIWRPESGRLAIADLIPRPCRWFSFDDANRLTFRGASGIGTPVPFGKFVLARHFPTYDNPFGLRLLSRCLWPVTFKRGGLKFWAEFLEKFGSPWVIGKYRQGASREEQQGMLSALASMVQSAVAVVSQGAEVAIEERSGTASGDLYAQFCSTMDSSISKALMLQTLTAEIGDKGARAAVSAQADILEAARAGDRRLVKTALDEIAWLYGLVNAPGVAAPVLAWDEPEDLRVDRAKRDNQLKTLGVTFTPAYFQRHFGLAEDEFSVQATQEPGASFAEGAPPQTFTPEQQAIEDLIAESLNRSLPGVRQDFLVSLAKSIGQAQDVADLSLRLAGLLADQPTLSFDDVLAQALTAARMYGRWTVRQDGSEAGQ